MPVLSSARIRGLGLGLALAVAAAVPATAATAAKTLVFCSQDSPETLSPPLAASSVAMDAIRPVFDTLVAFAPGTTDIVPSLATHWSISPDGRDYTFHLREDVAFQASEAFTPTRAMDAADVIFSFGGSAGGERGADYEEFRDPGLAGLLESVTPLDDHTVRFRLKRSDAALLAQLAMPVNSILSAEYRHRMVQQGTPERFDERPIGTGPFRFLDFRQGVAIRYQAFEDHWRGRPKLDTLVFSITPTASARLQKLKAGECQVSATPNPGEIAEIAADPSLRLFAISGLSIGYLAINTTRKPFDDVRVRRALNMAIDREAILSAIYPGMGTRADTPLPSASWASAGAAQAYPYAPEEARRLLIEAGVTDGLKVDLWYPPDDRSYNPDARRMARMIASDLEPLGIKVVRNSAPWETYWRKLMNGETTLALAGWIGDNGDPDNFMATLLSCAGAARGGHNVARWCDAGYDTLIERARQVTDRTARARIYADAQAIFHEQAPWVPIASPRFLVAARATVMNFVMNPLGFHDFSAVDLAE
ncbi:family 5 extracellular solute-binding protein [Aurantimonas sp. 22II-16-19i]|nr:family 5 extracellular solute-binding protein [Aurantimonas sp. 22II-16-19i]